MSIEERIELHEQWLLSMESNQSQFAANLAELERKQEQNQQQINQITEILSVVAQSQVALQAATEEAIRRLAETVEQYIRFRGDGRPQN